MRYLASQTSQIPPLIWTMQYRYDIYPDTLPVSLIKVKGVTTLARI